MDDVDEIIDLIRHYRTTQKIPCKEVAARMNVSESFVRALEYKRDVDRRWGTIKSYAAAVGCTLDVEVTFG